MKIDLVVGNPPYTHKLHIPFMNMGHVLAEKFDLWITPDDWVNLESNKPNIYSWLNTFNSYVRPNIKKIRHFEKISEVFSDVSLPRGCTITLADKNLHKTIDINNTEITQKDLQLGLGLSTLDKSILEKVDNLKEQKIIMKKMSHGYFVTFKYSNDTPDCNTDVEDFVYIQDSNGIRPLNVKYCKNLHSAEHDYKLVMSVRALSNKNYNSIILKPKYVPPHSYCVLYTGTEEEVKYADSYFSTKLIRWLVWRFFYGTSLNNLVYRHVPNIPELNHNYTDEELYTKYDLTVEEINYIENYFR